MVVEQPVLSLCSRKLCGMADLHAIKVAIETCGMLVGDGRIA